MIRCLSLFRFALLLLCLAVGPARAEDTVSISLVLAIDDSSSIKQPDYELQMRGIRRALTSDRFVDWLENQPGGIAVTAFLFSAAKKQTVILPWTRLLNARDAAAAARRLEGSAKTRLTGLTAVGAALDFAMNLLETSGIPAHRRVIDVSGDGENNDGPGPKQAVALAEQLGITINALAILKYDPDVGDFYRQNVRTSNGFVIEADDFDDFEAAILKKLLLEVAGERPSAEPRDGGPADTG